jgi:phospholipid/cholesterol/gamma-HCH transport system substrate-binding protein
MKFKIKYADQIVGACVIMAFVFLIAVIFMLGSKQRWFAKDYEFRTSFDTATGISVGMPLLYKGFTIGKIKSLSLNVKNEVDVEFSVYDTYYDRAKEGSLVELIVSPIGLGNQFLFHPGSGAKLIPGKSFIPRADTPEGRALIDAGLVTIPKRDDTVSNLIAQVNPLLTNLNGTLEEVNGALRGTGKGPLSKTLNNVSGITGTLDADLPGILADIKNVTDNVNAIATNLKALSASLNENPNGPIPALIDPDGSMFKNLESTFSSLAGTLDNIEGSSALLKSEMPQIGRLIEDLRVAIVNAQDVLESLKNNPLLKNGVPQRVQTDSSGTNSRNIDF